MNDPKRNAEFDFDECLREELSYMTPPESVIGAITPWRNATRRILIGCALTMITFEVLMLQYILPAIGMVMMLTGFRTLRQENVWFARGYRASLLCVILQYPVYFVNATIWGDVVAAHPAWKVMTTVRTVAYLVQLLALWQGMRQVQKKAGREPKTKAGLVLVLLYILLWGMAAIDVTNVFLILLLLIVYILAWRNLCTLSQELEHVGYVVRSASLRVPDQAVQVGYFVMIFLCLGIGYVGFSKYPMTWSEKKDIYDSIEVQEICKDLIALGFPKTVLEDLTPEDILLCQGAKRVVVQQNDHAMVSGEYGERRGAGGVYLGKYEVKKILRITGIGIEMAGEPQQWKLIHHFSWLTEPKMIGTEGLQIWGADHVNVSWYKVKPVSGQVLYDQNDLTYAAPYYRIENTEKTWENYLSFSYPKEGERYRGYVTYHIQKQSLDGIIDTVVHYIHHTDLIRYPLQSAVEYRKYRDFFLGERPYDLVWDGLQFFPPWLDGETTEQPGEGIE